MQLRFLFFEAKTKGYEGSYGQKNVMFAKVAGIAQILFIGLIL